LLVLLAAAAMVVAVALAYTRALEGSLALVWDDHALVEGPRAWRHAGVLEALSTPFWPEDPFSDAHATYYRPVVLVSFQLDLARASAGQAALALHTTNVAVHLGACVLLAWVAVRLGASGGSAILAALVWGLAPRLTESVAWVSGRPDVFATLLALAAFALAPDVGAPTMTSPGMKFTRAAASGACMLGALLAKEVAVGAALALAVVTLRRRDDATTSAPRRDRAMRAALTCGAPLVVWAALRTYALAGATVHARELGVPLRTATVLEAIGRYAVMALDALRPRTSIGMIGEPSTVHAVVGALVVVSLATGALFLARRRVRASRGVVAGASLAAFTIAPVLHIVPFNIGSAVAADRLLYLPLAGVAIALAASTRALPSAASKAAAAAALAAAVACVAASAARVRDYEDEVAFWAAAAEGAHPANTMARNALAGAVRDAGRPELACRLFEASRAVQDADGRSPESTRRRTRENLAACWSLTGRYAESVAAYEALARASPDSGRIALGLAFARLHTLDFDGATDATERARDLDPALAPLAADLRGLITTTRAQAPRFETEEGRSSRPLETASFYRDVGRGPDAERWYLVVARNPSAPPSERRAAVTSLVAFGSVEAARSAVDACHGLADGGDVLPQRERRLASVDRLAARLEALATSR
jgi:tetratricopeptide (TPR) repeat protein